jgi:Tol biopolymer transport system component
MGEVYRATDTRLKRVVALKILGADLTSSPQSRARFDREAQLLAALNHPHIAAIYGVEDIAGGGAALVLEYVEGLTLAERLLAGPLKVSETLPIARQIASALEAAHERGIVHRDLKPANIKITPAGQVKVLDFGIGKIADAGPAAATAAATRTGLVLGTPAYMSPEQARGQPIDKRTDIWAFGCVLYEVLTGRGAFAAETGSDSLAKVIEREPDFTALPADVPASIRSLVKRCLQKDPADRLHDIADARVEISEAMAAPAHAGEAPARPAPSGRLMWAAIAVAALALVAAAAWWRPVAKPSPSPPPAQAAELGITFPNNFMTADGVAISPDGRQIAANVWSNLGDIWVASLDGSPPRPLHGGENASNPFWSPDSVTIGFFRGADVVTMRATGGPPTPIATVASGWKSGSWNRDGVILVAAGGKLFRLSAQGGSAPVPIPLAGVTGELRGPTFLPDGRHFVVCAEEQGQGSLVLASLDGEPVKVLGESECPGGFAPPDHVLFIRGTSLLAQKLDLGRLTLEGGAEIVATGVARGAAGPWPELTPSASDTGVLVFPGIRGGGGVGQLTWFDRNGKTTGTIPRPADDVEYLNPAISPDGTMVAANRMDPQNGRWQVWLIDLTRGNAPSQLSTDSASDPVWSYSGKEILYLSDRDGHRAFYRQSIAGGPATPVIDVGQVSYPIPYDWTREGRIVYDSLQSSGWTFLMADPHAVGPQPSIPQRIADGYGARLSPDGKWLAFSSWVSGRFELFVERFPDRSLRSQISTGSGVHPRWTKNGKEIVYWAPPGGILANDLTLSDQEIKVGPTRTLVDQPAANLIDARTAYDITRDGERILVRQLVGPPSPGIRVIVNWTSRLK